MRSTRCTRWSAAPTRHSVRTSGGRSGARWATGGAPPWCDGTAGGSRGGHLWAPLLAEFPAGIPVPATTATANSRVIADVAEQMSTGSATAESDLTDQGVLVLRGSLDRSSLHLGVCKLADQPTRLAWLAQNLKRLN